MENINPLLIVKFKNCNLINTLKLLPFVNIQINNFGEGISGAFYLQLI